MQEFLDVPDGRPAALAAGRVVRVRRGTAGGTPDTRSNGRPATVDVDLLAEAARIAVPGDTVLIAPGVYRERVVPLRGGTAAAPIRYVAARGSVVLKGSVVWKPDVTPVAHGSPVVVARVDATLFPGRNLLTTPLARMPGQCCGQLFLDGIPMSEMPDTRGVLASPGTWHAIENGSKLIFHPPCFVRNVEEHVIELTVLDRLFAPLERGLGHIHLDGIGFEHCGNQFPSGFWKPPGDDGHPQAGAVGMRGGHHWVVRRCSIHHAKTIGLDCGDEGGWDIETGEPIVVRPGYHHVGYHLIEDNDISDNGACGIAGAGGRETHIVGNRVERNNAVGFRAPETAGIKLHFIYDSLIADNLIRDNDAAGIWLDNEWYGSRICRNVCLSNLGQGIFVELGEGPCTVDHNVCAMTRLGDGIYCHDSSGIRIVHNLLLGNAHFGVYQRIVTDRGVADHTGVQGTAASRDNATCNNVFIDNYRGAICLPMKDEDRVRGNLCDHNLFIDGVQWQWAGHEPHRFLINTRHAQPSAPPAGVTREGEALLIGPDEWRQAGHDLHSRFETIGHAELDDGAPIKGWSSLATRVATLWLADPRLWRETQMPAQVESTQNPSIPGPFTFEQLSGPASGLLLPLWRWTRA